jgi:hypothetical protein
MSEVSIYILIVVWEGNGMWGGVEYLCHCFPGLVDELGVVVAEEGVGTGFGCVLEAAHFGADSAGVGAK